MSTVQQTSVLTNTDGVAMTTETLALEVTDDQRAELASFEAELSGKVLEEVPELVNPEREGLPPADTEVPPTQEVVPEGAPPAQKYAQITEEQLARLLTYSTDIEAVKSAMESRFGTAFGKLGSLSQTLKEMQTQGDAGEAVVVSEDDLAELKTDYPDLTPAIAKSLSRVMSKVRGGNRVITKEVNPEEFSTLVETKATEIAKGIVTSEQFKDLGDRYPHWEQVIGKTGTITPFRTWLSHEPAEYQHRVNTSTRPVVVERALDRYHEVLRQQTSSPKPRKSAAEARREQLKDSVTERGQSTQVQSKSEEDAFNDHMSKVALQ